MTRNQPGLPSGEYPYGDAYGYGQQQERSYNEVQYEEENNGSDADRRYNEYGTYPPPGPPHYSEDGSSYVSAQSYSASNSQPYQTYPGDNQLPVAQYSATGAEAPPYNSLYSRGESKYLQDHSVQPSVYSNDSPSASPAPTHDRGLMGALAGGAAGAYGGHKVHHGLLGTLGGAVAGSLLEDRHKKHEKEKHQREEEAAAAAAQARAQAQALFSQQQQQQQQQQRYPDQGPPGPLEGNFSASSRGIRLEGTRLIAEAKDCNGRERRGEIELNDCLTNSWGRIEWRRNGNFGPSSRGIRLVDDGSVLEVEANNGQGGWMLNRVWLNERITNDDGRLKMLN